MRKIPIIFLVFTFFRAHSQVSPYKNYKIDTLYLKPVQFKKTLAYSTGNVTLWVDYREYEKMFHDMWKTYHEGMKSEKQAQKKKEAINPDYEPRWRVVDSMYREIMQQAKTQDTVFVNDQSLSKFGAGAAYPNFFPDQIEKGRCGVTDDKNEKLFILIRIKGSTQNDFLDGVGGRAYFLPGHKEPFVVARDWSL